MQTSQCFGCVHWEGGYKCKAFPVGIPPDVYLNEVDHREEFPGDNGIRWTPKAEGVTNPLEGQQEGADY